MNFIEGLNYILNKLVQVTGIGNISWSNIILYTAIVCSVFVVEFFVVGWNKSALRKLSKFEKSTRNDVVFWLLEIFNIYNFIAFMISLGTCYYLVGFIQKGVNFELSHYIDNAKIQFSIVFILSDFKNYVRHRVFHNVNTLWKLHSFHHSATSFSVLTRYRGHFLEMSISRFFDVIPFVILGAPIQTYFAVKILSEVHQLIIHSNITSNWSLVGKYILVSPAAHRIHHSKKEKHFNKNFGNTFIFWDRLLGTYYAPDTIPKIGIPENIYNKKGVVYDIYITAKLFFVELKNMCFNVLKR